MSKYLLNNNEGVLSVGLTEDGEIARIGHTVNLDCTFQQGVDIIHTKETYLAEGLDNPDILAFFNRSEDDPLYGILFTDTDGYMVSQTRELIRVIRERFPFKEAEEYPQLRDEFLSACVLFAEYPSSEGMPAEQIVDAVVAQEEPANLPHRIVRLAKTLSFTPQPDDKATIVTTRAFYKNDKDVYVSNGINFQPSRLLFSNEGELLLNDNTTHTSVHVELPSYLTEYYVVHQNVTINEYSTEQPKRYISYIVNKINVVEGAKVDGVSEE